MADMKLVDQFEFHGVKYSLYGRYSVKDFCEKFLDGEFPRTSTYILHMGDGPMQPFAHRTMQLNIEKLFSKHNENAVIAVYERMSPLGLPEIVCGNCRKFYRHYVTSDDTLGLSMLMEGHCTVSGRIVERMRDENAEKKECFEWNAECSAVLEAMQQIRGRCNEEHFAILLNRKRRLSDEK